MFTLKKPLERTALDEAIDALFSEMNSRESHEPEYSKAVDQLAKLYALKDLHQRPSRVSPDTLALVLGNLAGILVLVGYEKTNVMTSKALGLLLKPIR